MCLYFLKDDATMSLYKVTGSCGKTHMAGTASMHYYPEHPVVVCTVFLSGVRTYTFLLVTFFTPADTCMAPVYSLFQFCLPQGQNFFQNLQKNLVNSLMCVYVAFHQRL